MSKLIFDQNNEITKTFTSILGTLFIFIDIQHSACTDKIKKIK